MRRLILSLLLVSPASALNVAHILGGGSHSKIPHPREASPPKQRVVVFHPDRAPPSDALETRAGFVSVVSRAAPYRSGQAGHVEEMDSATSLAWERRTALAMLLEPTPRPGFEPRTETLEGRPGRRLRVTPPPGEVELQASVLLSLQRNSSEYAPTWNGTGTFIYLPDSGVETRHPQLRNVSIVVGRSFTDAPSTEKGHGTFMAGTIARVAPGATIVSVPVVGASESGTVAGLALALGWIAEDCSGSCVVSLSVGSTAGSPVLKSIVRHLQDAFDVVVVAAAPECSFSPGKAAIAAGHSESPCVDVRAPGTDVAGANAGFPPLYVRRTGASVSTAIMAGVAAQVRHAFPNMRAPEVRRAVVALGGQIPTPETLGTFAPTLGVSPCHPQKTRAACVAFTECVWVSGCRSAPS